MIIILKELNANVNALCISSTLISTSSASRAISAVAEILAIITYDVAQQNSVSINGIIVMRKSLDCGHFVQLCGRLLIMRKLMRAHNRIILLSICQGNAHVSACLLSHKLLT